MTKQTANIVSELRRTSKRTYYTIGAFTHVLLVIAVVLFLVGLLSGRRPAL